MEYVLIKSGTYQKLQIADKVFPVVKQFKAGARGSYITVDGTTLCLLYTSDAADE